ncbi:hypothetical protein D3C85_1090600 [compost metagenome]
MRIRADTPGARWGQCPQLGQQAARLVEQGLGLVAAQPGFQLTQVLNVFRRVRHGHLMRAPGIGHLMSMQSFGASPTFWGTQHDHRPAWTCLDRLRPYRPRLCLGCSEISQALVKRAGHFPMHGLGGGSLDKIGLIPQALKVGKKLGMRDTRQNGRIGDLVSVQMQDGQHRSVAGGIQEFVRLPGRRKRPGFRLAVADHGGDNQVRVVECRAKGV